MKVITDIEQGTKEWHDLRRCKVTGTKLDDVMGTKLARTQLIAELIAEEGTEQSKILRPTAEMERGTAEEVFTVKRYEDKLNVKDDRVTMCISDEFPWLAVSPDGLIKDKNGKYTRAIEVKNPDSKTLIFYKMIDLIGLEELGLAKSKEPFSRVPAEYKWQVVDSFLVNEDLETLDFIISDARFIEDDAKMYIVEVKRDDPKLQEAMAQAREELQRFRLDWLRYKEIVLPTNF
ncbi:MAG: putative Exonuclease [Chitinophagaceae bacterium]|nr:putative Exonuclease [Chitinophagaceae bacterium]